jgi:transcriptional regulator with XRE-family HTH domain
MGIGKRLKALRKKLGLTQKQFAERVEGKIDYTYIGKIEREEQYPSLKMLEKIGKAFSIPLGYFFEDETSLESLNLLPQELKELLKDTQRQNLLKKSRTLAERDLGLVMQIMEILGQTPPSEGLLMAEKKGQYEPMDEQKRKYLIARIKEVLSSPPTSLSSEEPWLKECLKIALRVLEKPG